MIRTPSLGLRNRLAEVVLHALRDPKARGDLGRLAAEPEALPAWAPDASTADLALARARVERAWEALAACPTLTDDLPLDQTLEAAARLCDAGLYFEVHELLEPLWTRAEGAERQALQGLIQIAVGYQHLANGNLPGARALLAEGSARLRAGHLPGLELDRFADAVAAVEIPPLPDRPLPRYPRKAPSK